MRALLAAAILALAGCGPGGYECTTDPDCGGDQVCANTHACVGADEVKRLLIRWTIRGEPASATTCAAFSDFELSVYDDDTQDSASYAPVPCSTGQFLFDKLPVGMDRVRLRVLATGQELATAIPAGDGEVSFDVL